jgi:hypothetical protein
MRNSIKFEQGVRDRTLTFVSIAPVPMPIEYEVPETT